MFLVSARTSVSLMHTPEKAHSCVCFGARIPSETPHINNHHPNAIEIFSITTDYTKHHA